MPGNQNSNLCHELAHALLFHHPTPAMDDTGCRLWNQNVEDEAAWLGGVLLIPDEAALSVARAQWSLARAAGHYGVSQQMVRWRLGASGATARVNPLPRLRGV